MIISIEGCRCSGKSFLIKRLEKHLYNINIYPLEEEMREIYLNTPALSKNYFQIKDAENWFLKNTLEKLRKAEENKGNSIIVRDYLSLLAYSFSFEKTSGIKTYEEFYSKLLEKKESNELKLPDLRLVVYVGESDLLVRSKKSSKLEDIWKNEEFLLSNQDYILNNYDLFGVKSLLIDSYVSDLEVKKIGEIIENV